MKFENICLDDRVKGKVPLQGAIWIVPIESNSFKSTLVILAVKFNHCNSENGNEMGSILGLACSELRQPIVVSR